MGNRTRVKVVKNKVAPPFVEAEFDILFARGIWWAGSVMDSGIEHGLVEKRGSWLSFDGAQLGQGREAAAELLGKDPALEAKLIAKIKEKLTAAVPAGGCHGTAGLLS